MLAGNVAAAAAGLTLPWLLGRAVDALTGATTARLPAVVTIVALAAAGVLRGGFQMLAGYSGERLGQAVARDRRLAYFDTLQRLGFGFHDRIDPACDLGRLVVLDSQGGNAESFLVARAFRLLRREKPEVLSVISYADPVRRTDADGRVFMPGHVGGLYAVMAARYVGRSSPRTDLILPDGRPVSSRAVSKIRNAECGQRYAVEDLLRAGAHPPRDSEDRAAWLASLEGSGFLRRRRHPGCHAYVFPRTRAARNAAGGVPAYPYPSLDHAASDGDVTALPLLARAV